jgi:hypothetical protein
LPTVGGREVGVLRPLPVMRVGEVDSCRVHLVELLALARYGVGQVYDVEDLGAAEAGDLNCSHELRLGSSIV